MPKYPFSPEFLDALPEELAELFRSLEDTLLVEICSRLKLRDELNEVTIQDIRALRSHGIDLKEIKKAIRKTTGISEKKLNELLNDVVERNQKYYDSIITLADVTKPDVLVSAVEIAAIKAQTLSTFRNITASMGFLVDAGRTFLPPAKAYQWALDSAVMQIESGAISYNQAIRSAVQQLAQSGIKVVDYESGHRDQIDVAARRAVMTGVNQINRKYSEQSMDFLQTDLVSVEAHAGARDTDGPNGWENHKAWQGKIYRWAEYTEKYPNASSKDYPDFAKICGIGDVQGILGANCRHSWSPFVEGVMEPPYTEEYLKHIDDGLGCTYDGKTYTAYEATQMQRRVERQIRAQKRLRDAYKAAGLTKDTDAANIKLHRLNTKYKEFSKAAGLPEQRQRLQALYTEPIKAVKPVLPISNNIKPAPVLNKTETQPAARYADVTEQWRKEATPNSHIVQDLHEYTVNGVTYKVDGHNVVLDYSPHEKEIAELLEKEFGGELYMVPRINNPQGISTPDYLFRGIKYDLKTIGESAGANTIFNRIKKANRQASRFVVDVTNSKLSQETVNEQIEKLFTRRETEWVNEIIVIRGDDVAVVSRT